MNTKLLGSFLIATFALTACDRGDQQAPEATTAKPTATAPATAEAKSEDAPAGDDAKAEPKKLDKDGLEAVADAVKFDQGDATDKGFKGKLENTSEHAIGRLEYKAFAYDDSDALIEMISGKHPKALDAGASAEIEVGPFEKAAGKEGVTVEVVVSWMNVGGTSYQRPVPKDRAKGGPNNALKK